MRKFKICFEISEPKLATIVSLLGSEVSALNITEVADPAGAKPRRAARTIVSRSSPALDSVVALLRGHKVGTLLSPETIKKALSDAKCSPNSSSPIVSRLVRAGVVARERDGRIKVLDTTRPVS